MPPPRRSSPRRRDRRSRSRSYSPRQSYTGSRRPPQDDRRSPLRNRSRSPKRRSRSLSMERGRPIKREPVESSGRHMGYRSRSPSPGPAKRAFKEIKEEPSDRRRSGRYSPERRQWSRERSSSPRHHQQRESFEGKMYADKPPSSKKPLMNVREKSEILSVKIIDKVKREKLDKRFRTLEQLSQGPFDFEENITIGIHRGPQHIELNEDVPVNYDINFRMFVMLFPKKDYTERIFDRDEIRAFRHDDILDEEAYVEKRTITMRPSEKQQRKYADMDYKITIGHPSSSKDYDTDRRMVRDVGHKDAVRPSWHAPDVTVKLDPKPDPRYEKLYRDSQKDDELHSKVQRNPNDLRHNLERRHQSQSDDGREYRSDRDRDSNLRDARYRIESGRGTDSRRGERPPDRARDNRSPPRQPEKRKPVKTELPDFKNRPVSPLRVPHVWIVGSSLIKDTHKYLQEHSIGTDLGLQELLADVQWHGEMDMKIGDILAAVRFMKKSHQAPQMIVIHCGDNNVCEGKNVDNHVVMERDLKIIQEEFPGVRIVWSQILPSWNKHDVKSTTLSKSRRRINRFIGKDVLESNGCLLRHPEFRGEMKNKYFHESSDGGFHLSKEGLKLFISRLQAGIKYFIEGHGTVFPYIKWPPADITELSKTSIPMLNAQQINDMTKKQVHKLSAKQIQEFTCEQITMFSLEQISNLAMQFLVSLTRKQLLSLTPKQLKGLSAKQFQYFKSDQVDWFSKEQNEALKGLDMSEVKRLQVKRLEKEKRDAMKVRPPGEARESKDRKSERLRSRSPRNRGERDEGRMSRQRRRSRSRSLDRHENFRQGRRSRSLDRRENYRHGRRLSRRFSRSSSSFSSGSSRSHSRHRSPRYSGDPRYPGYPGPHMAPYPGPPPPGSYPYQPQMGAAYAQPPFAPTAPPFPHPPGVHIVHMPPGVPLAPAQYGAPPAWPPHNPPAPAGPHAMFLPQPGPNQILSHPGHVAPPPGPVAPAPPQHNLPPPPGLVPLQGQPPAQLIQYPTKHVTHYGK